MSDNFKFYVLCASIARIYGDTKYISLLFSNIHAYSQSLEGSE